jgi:hypothetical protein
MMRCFRPDLLFRITLNFHSCGKYCGKTSATYEKSPSDEGLSYPKNTKPTIQIERTTCFHRGYWDIFVGRNFAHLAFGKG